MAADGKVPILESARAGYAFMRGSLRTVGPAAVAAAAVSGLAQAIPPGSGAALVEITSLAVSVMFSAFVLRLALRGDSAGFYGLRVGRDEANLAGAMIWVGFFFLILLLIGLFVFSIGIVGAARSAGVNLEALAGDPEAMSAAALKIIREAPLLWLLGLAGLAVLVWLSARLALVSAATIGEGRIMGFSTWSWTKDNALPIIGAMVLVSLPLSFALAFVIGLLSSLLQVQDLAAASPLARGVVGFIAGLGQYLFVLPAANGLMAHLYKGLRPPTLQPRGTQT